MKTMQVREKVEKSRLTVFFQWFVAPEGRKVGSLKRRVRGQMRDEKLHAVVARSTFRSQNAQNFAKHTNIGALLEAEMSKKRTPLWREAHFEAKCVKNWRSRTTFGSWDDVEKVHAVVARSTFPSQSGQNTPPKCWPANNEAGFDGTPSSWFLFWGYKAFGGLLVHLFHSCDLRLPFVWKMRICARLL